MKTKTQKIVMTSLFAALCCVATMIIKIELPIPVTGAYLNLGDSIVILAGWLLSPLYGFFAAGLGSALADVFLGSAIYAPATFVIKGLVALIACYGFRIFRKMIGNLPSRIISGIMAEIIMPLGYFLYECIIYDFAAASAYLPANAVQGVAGLIIGTILIKIFEKNKIMMD